MKKYLHNAKKVLLTPFAGSKALAKQAGMTLIEIIIVVALIGLIMTYVVTNLTQQQDNAMRDTARLAMVNIQQALQMYRVHNHRYPTTEQGLNALVSNPGNAKGWRGPYIEGEKLNDPWGTPFEYESSGSTVKIISLGPDLAVGTEDDVIYPEDSNSKAEGQ